MSYIVGWLSLLGWVTGCPSAAQLTSTLVQGLILLKNENANVTTLWQTTLFIMIFLIVAVAFNIFLASKLPLAEGIFLIVHIFGYFAFLIVLWTMSDHAPASQVFATFSDGGGWGNVGLSCLVGITTPLWCFLGPDAGAHMSEELKDAGRVLPSAMVWATFFNGLLGLTMIITLCFCIGDIDGVLKSSTGIPIIQVLYNATGSFNGTVVMTCVLIILSMVGTITVIAATSRQMWAFARDKGLPFSSYIEYVSSPSPTSSREHPADKGKGPAGLGHSSQQHNRHPPPLPSHLRLELRLPRRPQRHHLPLQRRPHLLLHGLHRLRPPQAFPQRTPPTSALVTGQVRCTDQRRRNGVLGCGIRDELLPHLAQTGTSGYELGYRHLRVRHHRRRCKLCG